jgi:hypothetical protein
VIPQVIIWTASEALPVKCQHATLLIDSLRRPQQGAFLVRQRVKRRRCRNMESILVVEDQEDLRAICAILTASGYLIIEVIDGR